MLEYSEVCDYCFKAPTPVETDGPIAYYYIIPKETGDISYLMSSGELMFKFCVDIRHPISETEMFVCEPCVDAQIEQEIEDDNESEQAN